MARLNRQALKLLTRELDRQVQLDPALAMGRDLVLRRYTWEACAASYDAIYAQLAARHGTPQRLANLRDKAVSR